MSVTVERDATSARRLDALVAMSRDRSATMAERALAASHAARILTASGIDYLTVYPCGLPVVDAFDGIDDDERDDEYDEFDQHVDEALTVSAR